MTRPAPSSTPSSAAYIDVLAAGPLSSVQDRGRHGLRALGIGQAGAADAHSATLGNLLVGNGEDAALLEITLSGPRLRFPQAARVALTGADIDARCNGEALPAWRPVAVPAGAVLTLGTCRRGVRAYLAIAGGIAVDDLHGSRATDLRAGFGGLLGRPLQAGDRLPLVASDGPPTATEPHASAWWIDPAPDLDLALPAVAALLPGAAALDTSSARALTAQAWRVAAASNRVGLRLQGPPLTLATPWRRPSEPVVPGTVQLPPDGQPIVLLGECGSHGGYPRIGHVASVDLPRIAQLRPGELLHFAPTTLADCDRRACARAARLARIALAIDARLHRDPR